MTREGDVYVEIENNSLGVSVRQGAFWFASPLGLGLLLQGMVSTLLFRTFGYGNNITDMPPTLGRPCIWLKSLGNLAIALALLGLGELTESL